MSPLYPDRPDYVRLTPPPVPAPPPGPPRTAAEEARSWARKGAVSWGHREWDRADIAAGFARGYALLAVADAIDRLGTRVMAALDLDDEGDEDGEDGEDGEVGDGDVAA